MKLSLLQALTPEAVTSWFKIKYFALITAAVDKDEQLPANGSSSRVFLANAASPSYDFLISVGRLYNQTRTCDSGKNMVSVSCGG